MINTCGRCPARWAGITAAHCGACHRTFGTNVLFDRHRSARGEHGACLDPAELNPPMVLHGDRWRGATTPGNAQRLANLRARNRQEG